jgi:hypothetical protein
MKFRVGIIGILTVLGMSLSTFGCVTTGSGGSTAAALPPCQVETEPSRDWRQVTADSISFCVPAGWTLRGQNQWQGRGGSIRWAAGPLGAGGRASVEGAGDPAADQGYRQTEVIGGFPVALWVIRNESQYRTGAYWRTPREMHMRGTATSEAAAELQLDIFRTARPQGGEMAEVGARAESADG